MEGRPAPWYLTGWLNCPHILFARSFPVCFPLCCFHPRLRGHLTFPLALLPIYFRLAHLWGCSANVLTSIGKTSSWCHPCRLAQTPKTNLVLKEMSTERFWSAPLGDYWGLTKQLTHLAIKSELLCCLCRETSPGPHLGTISCCSGSRTL